MQKLSCARPSRSLTPNPLQQCNRAAKPQVQGTHEGGRHLPRRGKRAHTGDRQAQVRRRERVGVAPPPGRIAARQVAVPDGRPPTCQKARKKLDGTRSASFSCSSIAACTESALTSWGGIKAAPYRATQHLGARLAGNPIKGLITPSAWDDRWCLPKSRIYPQVHLRCYCRQQSGHLSCHPRTR